MISLRSKISQKILNLFFLNENKRFYVNELARIIDEDPSNVYKKLLQFKEEGLVIDEFSGKERYFFLNKKYHLIKEYKKIVLKGIGFEKLLKEKLEKIKGIDSAYVFGSYVGDKLSSESDIDILAVGNFNNSIFLKTILTLQKQIGREINTVTFTKEEFNEKRKKDFFLKDIFSKKYLKII